MEQDGSNREIDECQISDLDSGSDREERFDKFSNERKKEERVRAASRKKQSTDRTKVWDGNGYVVGRWSETSEDEGDPKASKKKAPNLSSSTSASRTPSEAKPGTSIPSLLALELPPPTPRSPPRPISKIRPLMPSPPRKRREEPPPKQSVKNNPKPSTNKSSSSTSSSSQASAPSHKPLPPHDPPFESLPMPGPPSTVSTLASTTSQSSQEEFDARYLPHCCNTWLTMRYGIDNDEKYDWCICQTEEFQREQVEMLEEATTHNQRKKARKNQRKEELEANRHCMTPDDKIKVARDNNRRIQHRVNLHQERRLKWIVEKEEERFIKGGGDRREKRSYEVRKADARQLEEQRRNLTHALKMDLLDIDNAMKAVERAYQQKEMREMWEKERIMEVKNEDVEFPDWVFVSKTTLENEYLKVDMDTFLNLDGVKELLHEQAEREANTEYYERKEKQRIARTMAEYSKLRKQVISSNFDPELVEELDLFEDLNHLPVFNDKCAMLIPSRKERSELPFDEQMVTYSEVRVPKNRKELQMLAERYQDPAEIDPNVSQFWLTWDYEPKTAREWIMREQDWVIQVGMYLPIIK